MAKKNPLEQYSVLQNDVDFDDMSYDDTMAGVMSGMLEASNNQMLMAMELTKLIVTSEPVKNREDHVFSVFKKATKIVGENFAIKKLLEQFGQ